MKNISYPALAFILFFSSSISFSQNEYDTYTPPKVMEGTNLFFHASPNFSAYRNTNNNYSSDTNDNIDFNIYGRLDFDKWRFTPKLNYSFSTGININVSKHSESLLSLKRTAGNDVSDESYIEFSYSFNGGINYYFYKNLIYTGTYADFGHYISNQYLPEISFEFYPAIGIGQLYNAARVTAARNIEQVLIDEKITNSRLPDKTMKNLIELLDNRKQGVYLSKYKDDDEIEFFTLVEQVLRDGGVIKGTLDSRTVLKIYQAITNYNFVYFPNYKGYQVQAELNYIFRNRNTYSDSINEINSATISCIYGKPLSIKDNITGSLFFRFPLKSDYADYIYGNKFHTPITLLEKYDSYSFNNNYPFSYRDRINYTLGAKLSYYHLLNKTSAISCNINESYAKLQNGTQRNAVNIYVSFIHNVLNRMLLDVYAGFNKNYYSVYSIYVSGGISYYIF